MTCKMALIDETDKVCSFADGELARGQKFLRFSYPGLDDALGPSLGVWARLKGFWRLMSRVILKNEMGESNIRLQAGDMDRCPTRRQ
jgi:hypothetical protein